MRVTFHNELTGRDEELRPKAPPACGVSWRLPAGPSLEAFRGESFRSFLERALSYMGYSVSSGKKIEIQCGGKKPSSGIWLKPAGVSGADLSSVDEIWAKGFDPLDLRLLCLKTHYRRVLDYSWDALDAARAERAELGAAARQLEQARVAPNATGLAGYKKRFRDALAHDLDGPEALATVWDALRPGALSPGSRLGALKDADQVLDLLRLG